MSHPHTRGYFLTQVYEEFPVNNFIIKSDLLDPKCPRLADHNPGSLGDTLRLNPPGSVGGKGGVIDPPVKPTPSCERNPKNAPTRSESCQKGLLCMPRSPAIPQGDKDKNESPGLIISEALNRRHRSAGAYETNILHLISHVIR